MNKDSARTLDYFDRAVIGEIVAKYGLNEQEAFRRFIQSKTYQMLADAEFSLTEGSPLISFDMWECEQITGDPANSLYIRAEH